MEKRKPPRKIGPYTVVGTIGRGGMGIVYRVLEPETEKIVALKLLHPAEPLVDLLGMQKLHDLFTAEARKMSQLRHPNIVPVLDLDSDDGIPFFTMEYHCNNIGMMIGEKFILEQSTRVIRPDKVLRYGGQILEALLFMHAAGTVHRDIKPQNILVTEKDQIRICDFGMSREMEDDEERVAAEGLKVGTPYYISPEQNRDPEKADQRSDLYSTAVLLYRMLTGELPGMKSFLLSRINPLYDSNWDDFFVKALEWNPASRFQDAAGMAAALQHLELHWENRKAMICDTLMRKSIDTELNHLALRTAPVRVSGSKAREMFGVNELWQPLRYTGNAFTIMDEDTILDASTGLLWMIRGHDLPVDRNEADAIIAALNASRFNGLSSWRLPTVNELLTLVNDQTKPEDDCGQEMMHTDGSWYWSSDRRSAETSWYVNIGMGYTGWQENGCRYSVRAVASAAG